MRNMPGIICDVLIGALVVALVFLTLPATRRQALVDQLTEGEQ
jgi:hypothetical protein